MKENHVEGGIDFPWIPQLFPLQFHISWSSHSSYNQFVFHDLFNNRITLMHQIKASSLKVGL